MKYPGDESEQKWWKVCKLNITKILLREIKDINREIDHIHKLEDLILWKYPFPSVFRFNTIPIKSPENSLIEINLFINTVMYTSWFQTCQGNSKDM